MEEQFIMPVIIILVTLLLIFKAVIMVTEQTAYIIERFGKFNKAAHSGLGFIIPFVDRKAATVNLRVQQLDVTIETRGMVKEAYYSLDNPKNQIASYIFDDVRAEVPKLELDDVFAKKDDIAIAVQKNIAQSMDKYGYNIIKALITDIDPDHKVKESMNRINAAKREREAALGSTGKFQFATDCGRREVLPRQ